ncbi:PTS system mannose/fructose/sorbose family transporter subunit IID [Pseudodesulfovibrio piezophilus]|uniref:PTS system mannose/fructose/sorbose family IID component n=1 Tax=Pseudodesulfovibrio piezophilus (strain DSM 21447 / JCM 15486 / C1TLV30) TaxID=1322246 RepID=M1WW49_PSEP2|nr:PTS system mannose/fructose/sorbose family transporter subunit IID [Pseudodesulfovibrio piezophilus]CCH48923.1 PTS system mannose/fructose/sorbose family IID component [Pseudodesulfovibrio piezophilus C1TLV30]
MAFVRSFMRCYLAGAGFNTRGMQNLGLIYAMLPGLIAIHREPKMLRAAQKRYVRHYQSHPFWLPCLVGIYLNVEGAIAANRFPPKMLAKVKDTTAYTLSAIGDSVFAGSLLIFWALLSVCLVLSGQTTAALVLGVIFFVGLQGFKAYTYVCGLRQGFKFLDRLKRWDLINWGRRIKYVNAALIIWLWALIWPRPVDWWEWLLGVGMLMVLGRFVRFGVMSRVFAAAAFVELIDEFPLVEEWIKSFL